MRETLKIIIIGSEVTIMQIPVQQCFEELADDCNCHDRNTHLQRTLSGQSNCFWRVYAYWKTLGILCL